MIFKSKGNICRIPPRFHSPIKRMNSQILPNRDQIKMFSRMCYDSIDQRKHAISANIEENHSIPGDLKKNSSILSKIRNLDLECDNTFELMEIAVSENEKGLVEECSLRLVSILNESRRFWIESVLANPYDRSSCYFQINAGTGGTDAFDWYFF